MCSSILIKIHEKNENDYYQKTKSTFVVLLYSNQTDNSLYFFVAISFLFFSSLWMCWTCVILCLVIYIFLYIYLYINIYFSIVFLLFILLLLLNLYCQFLLFTSTMSFFCVISFDRQISVSFCSCFYCFYFYYCWFHARLNGSNLNGPKRQQQKKQTKIVAIT